VRSRDEEALIAAPPEGGLGRAMAGPTNVEFPGKKRQRVRMKGTKHANEDTEKRMLRQLARLLEEPERSIPTITGPLRSGWRKHPIERSLRDIDQVLQHRSDTAWLKKRMLAKRGDAIAKAFAGSLHAAHDTSIATVGTYENASFGSGAYVRRGDGKPAYLASVQNHAHVTLRMLAWEEHARHGLHFFSWTDGFVCSGTQPIPPDGWLEDVLARSRFSFRSTEVNGVNVHHTAGIDAASVAEGRPTSTGYVRLAFNHGPVVGIDLAALGTAGEKDKAFVHHLALSMLPPILPRLLTVQACWTPEGWPEGQPLPVASQDALDRLLDAWQGLTLNEGLLSAKIRADAVAGLDTGVVLGERWCAPDDVDGLDQMLASVGGSEDERAFGLGMILDRLPLGGGIVDARGRFKPRDDGALVLMEGLSLNALLGALWGDHAMAGLKALDVDEVEAEAILNGQDGRPKSFATFLRGLDETRAQARRVARFPQRKGALTGPLGEAHDLVVTGLLDGVGRAQKQACGRHNTIDAAASAWAWLIASGRHAGQEWHFEPDARERGAAWSTAVGKLMERGLALLKAEEKDVEQEQKKWSAALNDLAEHMGVSAP
jgi:hypothetical protein